MESGSVCGIRLRWDERDVYAEMGFWAEESGIVAMG